MRKKRFNVEQMIGVERAEPVLLVGEPGTGKNASGNGTGHRRMSAAEARALHHRGRASQPFIISFLSLIAS